jgi:acyl carrier protein
MTLQGISPITPGSGVQALGQAMRQQAPQLAVLPIDWAKLLAQFPAGGGPPLLSEMSHAAHRYEGDEQTASVRSELLRRLEGAVPYNRRRVLADYLYDQAKRVLALDPAFSLDPRQPLNELGLDSLMAIEMRSRLSSAVGQTLPATILFDYPTIEGLADYLAREVLCLPLEDAREDGEASAKEAGPSDVPPLPEGEVEALLAAELAAVQSLLSGGAS